MELVSARSQATIAVQKEKESKLTMTTPPQSDDRRLTDEAIAKKREYAFARASDWEDVFDLLRDREAIIESWQAEVAALRQQLNDWRTAAQSKDEALDIRAREVAAFKEQLAEARKVVTTSSPDQTIRSS